MGSDIFFSYIEKWTLSIINQEGFARHVFLEV